MASNVGLFVFLLLLPLLKVLSLPVQAGKNFKFWVTLSVFELLWWLD